MYVYMYLYLIQYIYIYIYIHTNVYRVAEPIEPPNIEPHSSQVHLSMFFLSYLLGIFSSNPGKHP